MLSLATDTYFKGAMATPPTQLPIDYKGKRYSGVYSISGNLMIARIPGISSKSSEIADDDLDTAKGLLTRILEEAEASGRL
jgi:hypothetical protein